MENTTYKVEHIWCAEGDRWIYIEKNEQMKIVGINFMQGDDYRLFKDFWCVNNTPLFEFYEKMVDIFPYEKASVTTPKFINRCMRAYYASVSRYEEYNQL